MTSPVRCSRKDDHASRLARDQRTSLNIRVKPEERALIDRAARARGQNRTAFILEAARKAAEDALVDQTMIVVDPNA